MGPGLGARLPLQTSPAAAIRRRGLLHCTLHRAPVGQGPSVLGWLATALGFWSGRALTTGTAWAGFCLIHHHHVASYIFMMGVFTEVPADMRIFFKAELRNEQTYRR